MHACLRHHNREKKKRTSSPVGTEHTTKPHRASAGRAAPEPCADIYVRCGNTSYSMDKKMQRGCGRFRLAQNEAFSIRQSEHRNLAYQFPHTLPSPPSLGEKKKKKKNAWTRSSWSRRGKGRVTYYCPDFPCPLSRYTVLCFRSMHACMYVCMCYGLRYLYTLLPSTILLRVPRCLVGIEAWF